ncbi:MAG: hypothetical protein FJW40_13195 [Acidobacteria bacterium]|nr:hypothetical protein [Acidobacteriota bacterium]
MPVDLLKLLPLLPVLGTLGPAFRDLAIALYHSSQVLKKVPAVDLVAVGQTVTSAQIPTPNVSVDANGVPYWGSPPVVNYSLSAGMGQLPTLLTDAGEYLEDHPLPDQLGGAAKALGIIASALGAPPPPEVTQ